MLVGSFQIQAVTARFVFTCALRPLYLLGFKEFCVSPLWLQSGMWYLIPQEVYKTGQGGGAMSPNESNGVNLESMKLKFSLKTLFFDFLTGNKKPTISVGFQ